MKHWPYHVKLFAHGSSIKGSELGVSSFDISAVSKYGWGRQTDASFWMADKREHVRLSDSV